MLLPFLVLYLPRTHGCSNGAAGFALTLHGIGALVTAPLWGRLADRAGALPIMKGSLFAGGAVMVLFPLLEGAVPILAATVAVAVSVEASRPASLLILGDLTPPEHRRAVFALHRLAIDLGLSVGPAVGGFLAMISFRSLFWVDGATSILAGLFLGASRVLPRAGVPAGSAAAAGATRERRLGLPADGRLYLFLGGLLLSVLVFFQNHAAMPLFIVRDLGLAESTYALMFAINTVLITRSLSA